MQGQDSYYQQFSYVASKYLAIAIIAALGTVYYGIANNFGQ